MTKGLRWFVGTVLLLTAAVSAHVHGAEPTPPKTTGFLEVSLALEDVDLAELVKRLELELPLQVAGRLSFRVKASIPLATPRDPKTYRLEGTATFPTLVLQGVELRALEAKFHYADGMLHLDRLDGHLHGGTLSGTGKVPLDTTKGTVEVDFANIDCGALVKAVPELPLKAAGTASGKLSLELPGLAPGLPHEVTATLTQTDGRLRIQNLPTRRLKATVEYRDGALNAVLEGETLGGRFRLDGQLPANPVKEASKPERQSGRLRLERAQLSRLADALNLPVLRPLSGRFDMDLPFATDEDGSLEGGGRFLVADVRFGDESVAEEMRGDVSLRDGALDIRDVTGRLAGGLARARVHYDLQRPDRSFFTLSAERVESSRLLRPLQGTADYLRGPVDVSLRGRLGSEWNGTGDVTLRGGRVLGVEVSAWRVPVEFRFVPMHGRGELTVHDSHAEVGRGRATGRANFRWGGANRLEGTLRFNGVEVRELLGSDSEPSYFGTGRASGRFDFGAADLRTINDVTGTLEASMSDTQALRMPVLRELVRYVAPGQGGVRFESGDVRGRLANGVFRVQQLALSSSFAQLVLDGTITLAGRLDLEATVRTVNLGVSPSALRLLGLRIPSIGPIPIGLILEITTALSNRILHYRITGTVRSPVVRVEPLRLLTEQAVRYFLLRELLPIP